jgi:hypothetical protein
MSIKQTFLAGALLLVTSGTSHAAATLTTSLATWAANAPGSSTTSTDPNYVANSVLPATTSSIALTGGGTLTTNPGGDAILKTFTDWGPWTSAAGSAYHGIVYDTAGQSETITVPDFLSAFGLEIQPDGSGPSGFPDVITVTLSDGQSTQISQTFVTGQTAFVGYYGGPETSMSISVQNAPDFALGDIRAVPEPGSLVLLASGVGIAAFVRRRTAPHDLNRNESGS